MFVIHKSGNMGRTMADKSAAIEKILQENNRLLRAAVGLLAQEYDHSAGSDSERIELVLAASGLGYKEIAAVLGKRPDAVRMMLARNKPSKGVLG